MKESMIRFFAPVLLFALVAVAGCSSNPTGYGEGNETDGRQPSSRDATSARPTRHSSSEPVPIGPQLMDAEVSSTDSTATAIGGGAAGSGHKDADRSGGAAGSGH
jgi:hypothetical protein